jgi:hypothetical protein
VSAELDLAEGALAERLTEDVVADGVRIIFKHLKNNYSYFLKLSILLFINGGGSRKD